MAEYRWRATFTLPGAPLAEPAAFGNISAIPAEREDPGHSRSTGTLLLLVGDAVGERETERLAQAEVDALAVCASAIGGSVGEPVIHGVTLENADELEAAGQRLPVVGSSFRVSINVVAGNLETPRLARGYARFLALPLADRARLGLVGRWLWKGNNDPNPYDRMLAYWTAFSVLYGHYMSPDDAEREGIEQFVATEFAVAAPGTMAEILRWQNLERLAASGLTLRRHRGPRPIAQELREALDAATRPAIETLTLLMLCVYALRCALVHEGRAAPDREVEYRLLHTSGYVLKTILMHALQGWLDLR
jgi:hypothetical protein